MICGINIQYKADLCGMMKQNQIWQDYDSGCFCQVESKIFSHHEGQSWSWSYDSCIYNYLCNQCLTPLTLWVQILLRRGVLDTTLCDKVCQWLTTGQWFSAGTLVSSTNKTDRNDITEILLKVALTTINQPTTSWNGKS